MRYGDLTECPECGAVVSIASWGDHRCDRDQRMVHQLLKARGEIDRFEEEFARFLATSRGRFEAWYAERTRAGGGNGVGAHR
jgi:hypothetical protein